MITDWLPAFVAFLGAIVGSLLVYRDTNRRARLAALLDAEDRHFELMQSLGLRHPDEEPPWLVTHSAVIAALPPHIAKDLR
jgi:hypothetical protein